MTIATSSHVLDCPECRSQLTLQIQVLATITGTFRPDNMHAHQHEARVSLEVVEDDVLELDAEEQDPEDDWDL